MRDLVDLAHNLHFLLLIFFVDLLFIARLLICILDTSADIPIMPHNREGPRTQLLSLEADGILGPWSRSYS